MSDLPKLMLCPLRNGYQFNLGSNTVTTEVEKGMPRQRINSIGSPSRVRATYRCTKAQFDYLVAFLRACEATAFLAQLEIESQNLTWYECRMMNKMYPVNAGTYGFFDISLDLVTKSTKRDKDIDQTLVGLYTITNGDYDNFVNLFEKLVNVEMPTELNNGN